MRSQRSASRKPAPREPASLAQPLAIPRGKVFNNARASSTMEADVSLLAGLRDSLATVGGSFVRTAEALHLDSSEITVLEEIAHQPAGTRGDNDRVRFGQGLQPSGEIWRFTDDRLLLGRSCADQIADDHQSGGDAYARLGLDGFDIEASHSIDDTQACSDRALGIVLMRMRVAQIDQYAVAHILGDKPVEGSDDIGNRAVKGGDDLAQILGIEPRRELGRAHEVAEHHRELTAFGT